MASISDIKNGDDCPTPRDLISSILDSHPDLAQFSTFSTTIYDSAWLSMIFERDLSGDEERRSQLFPACFEFILREQRSDGSWGCYGSHFDGILNSLAGLLSLLTYRKTCGLTLTTMDLERRINNAELNTRKLLNQWDFDSTIQVGFEILITGLLNQLHTFGIEFDFPDSMRLRSLYEQKMQRFAPEVIYSKKQTTILHSLEALVGKIDFDLVKHHCCEKTGIMGSPAATACYLIYGTKWDCKAEKYLRGVTEAYYTNGISAVPSAFPTSVFEITWILSSLLSSNISLGELDPDGVAKIASFLVDTLQINNGIVGFAPGVVPDADDTARTLMTLKLLGRSVNALPLIKHFEARDHFQTYEMERNPSFSTNCNVLIALLSLDDVDLYAPQISKTLVFMLDGFDQDEVRDKWNISPYYCDMLMMQAFVKVLQIFDTGYLQSLDERIVRERIPVAICRILLRTLGAQNKNGDWNDSLEETSYNVLTITQSLCLSWNEPTSSRLKSSLNQGKDFIQRHYPRTEKKCYIWIEKTTFELGLLKKAYCSIALHTEPDQRQWVTEPFYIPEAHRQKMIQLLSMLPIFQDSHLAAVDIILVEASHISKFLRRLRQVIFARDQIPLSKDKYLEFISVIWAMCNYKGGHALSAKVIRDMARLSLLNYQIDEYMEVVVGGLDDAHISLLISTIKKEFDIDDDSVQLSLNEVKDIQEEVELQQPAKRQKLQKENGSYSIASKSDSSMSIRVDHIVSVLRNYVSHIRTQSEVLASPPRVQRILTNELYTFLLAHLAHNADSVAFQKRDLSKKGKGFICADVARGSYLKWVHTTGADDTSCPFSFQFFTCLISHDKTHTTSSMKDRTPKPYCFNGVQEEYIAHTLARQLAVMCRMYNDYGSKTRDKIEDNLNSLDFEEFHCSDPAPVEAHVRSKSQAFNGNSTLGTIEMQSEDQSEKTRNQPGLQESKGHEKGHGQALMAIAEFERKGMELTMEHLGELIKEKNIMRKIRVFVDVTDTFGLLYVRQDIASIKIKKN